MNGRRALAGLCLPLVIFLTASPAESSRQAPAPAAQAPRRLPQPATPAAPAAAAPRVDAPGGTVVLPSREDAESADAVRGQLEKLLDRYSPNLGRIFALDPLLLQNPNYLEAYPDLVTFLNLHPEIVRNSSFYFSQFRQNFYPDREPAAIRMWNNVFQAFFILLGLSVVIGSIVWLIKTLVDYRRWYRLSKVQTETHNKLLDRFAANDELMAYMNTAAGRRFLESAPITLDASASITSPLKRILWAVEIGIVLACAAGGILLARSAVPDELRQPFTVAGTFVVSVGVGFILAALASFVISNRMGVLNPAGQGTSRTDATPAE
jgi:hypothetical protein